jgi:hypothetical protein
MFWMRNGYARIQNFMNRAVKIMGAQVVLCTKAHEGGFRAHTKGGGGAGGTCLPCSGCSPPLQNLLEIKRQQ